MRNLINQPVSQNIFPSNIIMDQQNLSLSSQEWPNLSPSPNPELGRKQILKNKKCDECNFVTHKTHNLKKHKNIHMKITPEPIETLKCQECDKTFTKKKALGDLITICGILWKWAKISMIQMENTWKQYTIV